MARGIERRLPPPLRIDVGQDHRHVVLCCPAMMPNCLCLGRRLRVRLPGRRGSCRCPCNEQRKRTPSHNCSSKKGVRRGSRLWSPFVRLEHRAGSLCAVRLWRPTFVGRAAPCRRLHRCSPCAALLELSDALRSAAALHLRPEAAEGDGTPGLPKACVERRQTGRSIHYDGDAPYL